jgi:hypothetical protein
MVIRVYVLPITTAVRLGSPCAGVLLPRLVMIALPEPNTFPSKSLTAAAILVLVVKGPCVKHSVL